MNEINLEEIKALLGVSASKLTDDQIKDIYVKMRCLIESWLDMFERDIFEGKTIQELL